MTTRCGRTEDLEVIAGRSPLRRLEQSGTTVPGAAPPTASTFPAQLAVMAGRSRGRRADEGSAGMTRSPPKWLAGRSPDDRHPKEATALFLACSSSARRCRWSRRPHADRQQFGARMIAFFSSTSRFPGWRNRRFDDAQRWKASRLPLACWRRVQRSRFGAADITGLAAPCVGSSLHAYRWAGFNNPPNHRCWPSG